MADILLKPQEFQGQIDSFQESAEEIKTIKYTVDKKSVQLQAIDRFIECINEYNSTVELFGKMLDMDTESMKQIKARWMNCDSEIATKTLKEVLFGE